MMNNLSNTLKKNNKKGFTLIELIVVIAILGILAAIAVPRFAGIQDRSKVKTDFSNATTIGSAAEVALAEGKISSTSTDAEIKAALTANNYLVNWPTPKFKTGFFTVEYDEGASASNLIKVYWGATDGTKTTLMYPVATVPDTY